MTIILQSEDIKKCVELNEQLIPVIEDAFKNLAQGKTTMPPILRLDIEKYHGESDVKAAYIEGLDSYAIKVASGFFNNPNLGLPSSNGLMILLDSKTGVLKSVLLDKGYLTDVRTAIAGAIAAKHLSNPESSNVGIIGAGNFASTTILPILRELKRECEVIGVASSGGLSAEVLSRNFKINNKYSTESEIIDSEEIDAVFILTQHHNHAELVIKAVNAGKAVYVEKPLALEVESLVKIEEAMYNAENAKIFVGFNRRFAEATQFVKSKLNSTPANSINFRFSVPALDKDHWTNIKEIGGGRIVGEAVHAIDLASYLFDSLPQSISASSPLDKENDVALDNQVFININFANGSHAAIQYFSETNQSLAKERIEIHGGGNSYIMEDFQMLRYLEQSDDKSKVFSKGKGHKESIQTFLTYVKGESNNPYTWLELKSVAKAAIYSQNYMNSGSQHSIFS